MTQTIDTPFEDQLAMIGAQVRPDSREASMLRIASMVATAFVVAAVWFFAIAPDDKSPNSLMVQPATELLESFIQPAPDMSVLSHDVGFNVAVPNFLPMGIEVKAVGKAEFGGQPAVVMQVEKDYSKYLYYDFGKETKLTNQMRHVISASKDYYVTSAGAVSVVVWKGRSRGYRALAAKSTENDLLAFASEVDSKG